MLRHLVGHVGRDLAVGEAPDRDAPPGVGQPPQLGLGQRDLDGDGDLEHDPVEERAHLGDGPEDADVAGDELEDALEDLRGNVCYR